jgi:hypothetical protein
VEGKFYYTEKKDKYRLHLMLDLVAPTDLDLKDSHVLSFLFGTSMETEYIKCGWDNANVLNDG